VKDRKVLNHLPCGCWYGSQGRNQPNRWHYCEKAMRLLMRWDHYETWEAKNEYDNHFKQKQ